MSTISACLLNKITVFRNPEEGCPNFFKVVAAEVMYLATIVLAIAEAAFALIAGFYLFAASARGHDMNDVKPLSNWAKNTPFTLIWSIAAALNNPFRSKLFKTQYEARIFLGCRLGKHRQESSRPSTPITSIEDRDVVHLPPVRTNAMVGITTMHHRQNNPVSRAPEGPAEIVTIRDPLKIAFYSNYELGFEAFEITTVFEELYARLPTPTADQLTQLRADLHPYLLPGYVQSSDNLRAGIDNLLILYRDASEWQKRTVKMIWAIWNYSQNTADRDEKEIIRVSMQNAFENCSNRKSSEFETIYLKYVERGLLASYQISLTPKIRLIYELMQERMVLRDRVINARCQDIHNAASHTYFRRIFNEDIFHLPAAPLAGIDVQHESYARKNQAERIAEDFTTNWNTLAVVHVFERLIYSEDSSGLFKPQMFIDWLTANNRLADAFEDDDQQVYRKELIAAYLRAQAFLL